MDEWFTRKLKKFALKEGLTLAFVTCCALAKFAPIFPGGNYQADAILHMLLFGLAYFFWDAVK